ncbi:MAG: hypothetical protein GC183_09270 [Thiobacillus sp.]|nr:hypothetical protein [Thiobacillus sp.]
MLGLNGTSHEFSVVYGSYPGQDAKIAVLTRSMLQVMIDFASCIEVPEADIAEGRVYSAQRTAEQIRSFPPLITVHHGAAPPDDADASVRYRNQWFWIDDRDPRSKHHMAFLMIMFSLTEGAPTQNAPVVTVPAR